MVFDYEAIETARAADLDPINYDDLRQVVRLAALGFRRHDPDLTEDTLWRLSPPITPLTRSVQRAVWYAYNGAEVPEPGEEVEKKKSAGSHGVVGWLRRWATPSKWGWRRTPSGA